jgi:peptidase M1-like protein
MRVLQRVPGRANLAAVALAASLPVALRGQAAVTYLERYREVMRLGSSGTRFATVDHVVLTRDAGQLTFEHGMLYLLAPVAGRTMGAVFQGQGRFTFMPPVPTEQAELERFAGSKALDEGFSEAILIFADSTAEEFRRFTFRPSETGSGVAGRVHDLLNSLEADNEGSLRADVIGPLLNGEASGFFLARLERAYGDPVLFEIDPGANEAVQLYRPVSRRKWGTHWAVVAQFPMREALRGSAGSWMLRQRLRVPSYRMDVRLTPSFSADLDFAAHATLVLHADEPIGPWLQFALHPKLVVDSARWGTGERASVFKAKDGGDVWVRAPRRHETGDSLDLTFSYHGNLIDRYSDWFFIDPGAAWYPRNGQGTDLAIFDVTYHAPSWYPLASIGDRTDSTVAGKVLTTRWVTQLPTAFATFNLGLFESYHTQLPGAPPLDVLISESAHRALARAQLALVRDSGEEWFPIPQQKNMRENVAADVANSLKLFTHLFGESLYSHFYVTEIPYGEGVSFPGMIDLSWSTFQNTSLDGFDEFFRAHEVAHQWWGSGVQQASYRDKWLSEGLASFSALWYLQSERKRNDEYFKFFDQYKSDIKAFQDDVGPIWIGYRNATPKARRGYATMIYEKGAWVFQMLRIMMLDLRTMKEDRFTEMMRDYYASYRGKPASTEDFQRIVERHTGGPMDWFFDQWVKGTAIPTYHVAWTGQPASGGKHFVRFRITQEHVPADFRMPVLVSVDLGDKRFAHFRIDVRGTQTEYASPLLPGEPKGLKFNELNGVLADVKMERW